MMTSEQSASLDAGLRRAIVSASALEALGNYQSADQPLLETDYETTGTAHELFSYDDDGTFWNNFVGINTDGTKTINATSIHIENAALSEWVARIPGLYWSAASQNFRKVAPENIESRTDKWTLYSPLGKSQKVTGGIGTMKLPPSDNGYRMGSLTTSLNASSGIPVLVSPEVWDQYNLKEGSIISGTASVRPMPVDWAREFPAIKGIPRACVVLDSSNTLTASDENASILIHPFSIMEYWENDAQLLDFVYAVADSVDQGYRDDLEVFFERYKNLNDRDGNYLIAADIAQPMWDAEFSSPADMRNQKNAELNLIEQRVKEAFNGEQIIGPLLEQLNGASDIDSLRQISILAGIRPQQWFRNGTQADESSRLVDAAVQSKKVAQLVQATQQVLY